MDDEKVISLTVKNVKLTVEVLLKALFMVGEEVYRVYQDSKLGDRIFQGETPWNDFMKSIDHITIKDLKTNEVNLEKFKEELAKYNIGFSFYKHSDGETISMAFSIKHKDIVEKSLAETLEKMVKDDKFREEVKKNPKKKRDLDEKLKYYKDVEKSVINEKKSGVENVMEKKGEKRL